MTGNEKFDNDAGRIGARMMMEANKSRKCNTLSKETIKQTVEHFLSEHDEKELNVAIYLDSNDRKPICNFHIDTPELETIEDSTKAQLVISDFTTPKSLIPDDVTIRYEEVTRCESTVRTGETEDDILADVLEIGFKNGTVLELGFLKI
ncbi:hypothetical protein FMM75_23450 [Lachnospiraceae bacterium MD335]|nr:hypothetical protein [Lachnospiraceae bacterium MD335]